MSNAKKHKIGDAVLVALENARSELDEREAKLEQREEALRKAVEGVDNEKRLMAGRSPSDVLPLNIGGTRCHVLRKTLCQFEKSMLAAHFSGRWDDNIEKDADGYFFIDQPPELMTSLINFLRAKAIESPTTKPVIQPESESSATMHRLIEYYGMTPFVYQQAFRLHKGQQRPGEIIDGPEPSVDCAAWSTFVASPLNDHTRGRVQSYSVVLGAVERPQIGWSVQGWTANLNIAEHKGVGEEGDSVALDRDRAGVFFNGASQVSLPDLKIEAGTVITCEKTPTHFRWLRDGEELASVSSSIHKGSNSYPAISGKGQWQLTQFTYFP